MRNKLLFFIFLFGTISASSQQPCLLKDLSPGTTSSNAGEGLIYPNLFAVFNNKSIFWAKDGSGQMQLWITDGTTSGTKVVVPNLLAGGILYSSFYKQTTSGLYFCVQQINNLKQIWYTDGTAENTKVVFTETSDKKVQFDPASFTALNDELYITGWIHTDIGGVDGWIDICSIFRVSPVHEPYTWWSAFGSLTEARVSIKNAQIKELAVFKNSVLFTGEIITMDPANKNVTIGLVRGLFTIDGSGQFVRVNFSTASYPYSLCNVNDQYLAFNLPVAFASGGSTLNCIHSISDVEPTVLASSGGDINNVGLQVGSIIIENKLFYRGDDGNLWVTNGTREGTFNSNFSTSHAYPFGTEGNYALMNVESSGGFRIIKWDGNTAVVDYTTNPQFINPMIMKSIQAADRTYLLSGAGVFVRFGDDLHTYKLFGVFATGTMQVDIMPYYDYSNILNGKLIGFMNNLNDKYGWEPYTFDLGLKVWTGEISTDWNNPANWRPSGVPTATDNIIIPEIPSGSYPVLNSSGTCKSLYINYGSVVVPTGSTLTISGELSNYAVLTGGGAVLLNGTDAAKIGSPFSTIPNPITIAGKELTLTSNTYTGALTLTDGSKLTLGNFDLITGTAAVTGDKNNYVVTNGAGRLITWVGNQPISYPVGSSSTSYTPVRIANTGVADYYYVRVRDGVSANGLYGNPITSQVVNKTWSLEEYTPGGGNISVAFQWNAADELSGFNRNNAMVGHYENNGWTYSSPTAALPAGTNIYTVQASGYTSFSPFIITSSATALPLRWITFSGRNKDDNVVLEWETADEQNVSHFVIERSVDGRNFVAVGRLQAYGNSNALNHYSYTDHPQLSQETLYYRLKQLDLDGSFNYSRVIGISTKANNVIALFYPNPVQSTGTLMVSVPSKCRASYVIFDQNGRRVIISDINLNEGTNTIPIAVDKLAKGIYTISISGQNIKKELRFSKD